MVARLSELLRLTLENNGKQEITLQQELEFVDRYLAIEKVRFEDRLTVKEEIRNDLREAMVPNMVLQPLVENAIRHGVSRKRGQATIAISAERENGSLVIHVVDNGTGLNGQTSQKVREGIGISNIRARLRHLYGDRQRFELRSPPDGGVEARLTIPFHTEMTT
jgi:sensor histidine kinase YesM